MKNLFVILFGLLAINISATTLSNDKQITVNELPKQSQQFIKKHFANQAIALVKKDSDLLSNSYEVVFSNGNKVEFDSKGQWETVDCRYSTLPTALTPTPIINYVNKHYPGSKVVAIEKESRGGYEVLLSNQLSLAFNSKYNLLEIGD